MVSFLGTTLLALLIDVTLPLSTPIPHHHPTPE
jgi:hypothetical protein